MQNASYTITVVATDNGQPENFNSSTTLTILVFPPDNFFSPVLDETLYEVSVEENSPVGTDVAVFSVVDGDQIGPAAEISTVILSGADSDLFEATITGPNTGVIRTM